jgi:hypothetical protein
MCYVGATTWGGGEKNGEVLNILEQLLIILVVLDKFKTGQK